MLTRESGICSNLQGETLGQRVYEFVSLATDPASCSLHHQSSMRISMLGELFNVRETD